MGFQIFTGRNGQFYWHLKGGNGEIICQSEGYASHQGAQGGINACVDTILRLLNKK